MFVTQTLKNQRIINKTVYLLFAILSSTFAWSQYTVRGEIKDVKGESLPYVNVLLLKAQDSTVVSGTSSDDNGNFFIENIAKGSYILKSSFIGFETHYKNFTVESDANVGIITLVESAESLSEIEIVVKKPTLKREVDRLVFNVEKTALSEGNMLEVLRSTPSVLVLDDAIQVKNANPTIYINNRKVHLSSSELVELLEGTSASSIKSIEVITNPSAKYDADSGVVLNIVMAKNLVTGYNGSVFANYTQGVFPKSNYGITNYFKGSKIDVFVNYNYNNSKIDRVNDEEVNYPDEIWNTHLDRNTWSERHNFGLNIDYSINDNNTISLASNAQFLPYFKYLTTGATNIDADINVVERFNSNNLSRDKKHNIGFDLDYISQFKSDAQLSLNAHYTNYDYSRDQRVFSDYYGQNNLFLERTAFNTAASQDTEIVTAQADFSTPLGEQSSLEIGTKLSNVKTGSDILQNDIINGVEVIDVNNSDAFDYDEKVYAAYANYSTNSEKLSFNAGVRVEQTNIEGENTLEKNTQDYLEWFPTVSLGYQISEKVNSYINYKRSIQRPNYANLNPFQFYLNDNTIVTGNPNLQPVFTDHYLIGTTLNDMFTFEVYYKKYENNIFELPLQDNATNIITYTPVNIKSTTEIGFDFETYFDVTERWSLYFGSSTYNYKDEGVISGSNVERDRWANYSILQNDFSFLKDNSLSASLSIVYIGENVQGLQIVDTRWDTFLSIKKTILKGKGVLSLSCSDLFNKQDYFVTTKFLDQDSNLFINEDSRYFRLGFRYKFGNTKLSTNQRSTSKEERERL
jgi:hypothetical protein